MTNRNELNMVLAEEVRKACLKAVKESFSDALMRGLCAEGAVEAAVGAVQSLDLTEIVKRTEA